LCARAGSGAEGGCGSRCGGLSKRERLSSHALIGFQGRGMCGCPILRISQFPTLDRSPMVQVNIKPLIDDVQCYQTVRALRWPDGITCPSCQSTQVIKRGFDDTEPARQRYECKDCDTRFDDLTDTMFAGHH